MAPRIPKTGRLLLSLLLLAALVGAPAARCLAANSTGLSVSAVLLSKNQCKFDTKNAVLDFGSLDPGNPVDVTVSAVLSYRCIGSAPIATFAFFDDDGLYETGVDLNRMQHATLPGTFIPYEFTLDHVAGTMPKNATQDLTVTGTLRGAGYQTALAGTYTDTVTITIIP